MTNSEVDRSRSGSITLEYTITADERGRRKMDQMLRALREPLPESERRAVMERFVQDVSSASR